MSFSKDCQFSERISASPDSGKLETKRGNSWERGNTENPRNSTLNQNSKNDNDSKLTAFNGKNPPEKREKVGISIGEEGSLKQKTPGTSEAKKAKEDGTDQQIIIHNLSFSQENIEFFSKDLNKGDSKRSSLKDTESQLGNMENKENNSPGFLGDGYSSPKTKGHPKLNEFLKESPDNRNSKENLRETNRHSKAEETNRKRKKRIHSMKKALKAELQDLVEEFIDDLMMDPMLNVHQIEGKSSSIVSLVVKKGRSMLEALMKNSKQKWFEILMVENPTEPHLDHYFETYESFLKVKEAFIEEETGKGEVMQLCNKIMGTPELVQNIGSLILHYGSFMELLGQRN